MVHPDLAEADDFDIQPRRSGPRKVKITREARTARLIFYLTPFVVLLLLFGPRFVLNSGRAKRALAVEVSEQVSRRAKASVRRMGSITFGWAYEPCLHASEIYRVRGEFEVVAKAKGAFVSSRAAHNCSKVVPVKQGVSPQRTNTVPSNPSKQGSAI